MATLSELKQQKKESGIVENPDQLKVLTKEDMKKIIPPKKEENTAQDLLNAELSDIDSLIESQQQMVEKKKEEIVKENQEKIADIGDAIFDAPVEDIDAGIITGEDADKVLEEAFTAATQDIKEDASIQAGVEAVNNVGKNQEKDPDLDNLLDDLNFEDDDDEDEDEYDIDDEDEDDDDEDEENRKKMLKDMKSQLTSIIKPFDNVVDLKAFTVAKKPKRATEVLKEAPVRNTASWVLLDSGVPFTCSSLGAVEIDNLDPNKLNEQNGRITGLKQLYGTLYSHYESPNKPKSLEEWLKTISFNDQDHLFFGYYKATFGLSNLITYACDSCNEVKIKETPIEDCVKYADDETKEEVENILKYGDPTHRGKIITKLVQVSDTLAVSIKNPSIYNMVFEFGVLEPEFTRKYADTLGVVGYIEDIYEIDLSNQQLIPIEIKEDPKNITKSVKRRIRAKVEILKNLRSDQYNLLNKAIMDLNKNSDRIKYRQPEYKCEKCGNEMEEIIMSAQSLLFTRHQLSLIGNLPDE